MSFINDILGLSKIECPRCLGKGNVDWEDIERLNKQLKWAPGNCAYCDGKGWVKKSQLNKLAVDTTYLITDISLEEREKLKKGEINALQRAELYEEDRNNFIKEVRYLHFNCNLDPMKLTDFYLLHSQEVGDSERDEFYKYILKIIHHKS